MSNRVEELERQVAELQAAVNGLTEELVETKERVRQLEDRQESGSRDDAGATRNRRTTKSDVHADVVEQEDDSPGEDAEGTGGDGTDDDLVVPGEDGQEDDTSKTPDHEESDDDGESEESDIIVA